MQKKICAIYGESAVTDQTRQKWFARFSAGDFLLTMLQGLVDRLKLTAIKLRH